MNILGNLENSRIPSLENNFKEMGKLLRPIRLSIQIPYSGMRR